MLNFLTLETDAIATVTPLGVAVLQASHAERGREARRALALKPVHTHWAKALSARLESPTRRPDDWSITGSLRCLCKLCATLSRYLRSPDQIRFEWPLAKEHRAHVHQVIDTRSFWRKRPPCSSATPRRAARGRRISLGLRKRQSIFDRMGLEMARSRYLPSKFNSPGRRLAAGADPVAWKDRCCVTHLPPGTPFVPCGTNAWFLGHLGKVLSRDQPSASSLIWATTRHKLPTKLAWPILPTVCLLSCKYISRT
jgi:hypothetical protein